MTKGQAVKHRTKKLHDARYWGPSRSGKRVGVRHNIAHPWGVSWVVSWFSPESIGHA